jgi:hypothetical protein
VRGEATRERQFKAGDTASPAFCAQIAFVGRHAGTTLYSQFTIHYSQFPSGHRQFLRDFWLALPALGAKIAPSTLYE